MNEYIDDPEATFYDLDQRIQDQKARLRYLAAQAAQQVSPPQGQMAGKFYVAPHWTQNLSAMIQPGLAGFQAGLTRDAIAKDQAAYDKADRQARQAWLDAQPQTTSREQAGPVQIGAPPLQPLVAQPTQQQRLAWLQSGQHIPSLRDTIERAFNDTLIQEPARQGERAARAEEAAAARADRAAEAERQRVERGEQLAADRVAAAERAKQHDEVMKAIAAGHDSARRYAVDNRPTKPDPAEKVLPPSVVAKLGDQSRLVESTTRFYTTFKDDYAGLGSSVRRAYGTYAPESMQTPTMKATSAWWNDYQAHKNTVRHSLFGSALTATEKGEWEKSDINPDMNPGQVRENLARRAVLEQRAYDKMEGAARASTRTEQLDALRPRTGGATGSWEAPVAPARPASKAERDALPPGTLYIGPDGKTYRR